MITVQVSEASSVPSRGGQDHVVLGGADREPVCFLPGRRVQPGHAGSVGQPAAVRPAGGQGDAFFHAGDDVPARRQDRRDQVIAREVPVEADDAAGEQARAAPHEPFQQGLLPGSGLAEDRPEHGAAGAGGHRDDPELRERARNRPRSRSSRRTPGSPACPPGSPASRRPRPPACPASMHRRRLVVADERPGRLPEQGSPVTSGGTGSRQSVTTFPVGTCHSRANGMSASSPASRASASQYDASGISVIAIISRMTSGYDMIRRRCRGLSRPCRDRGVHGRLDHPVAEMALQLAQPDQVRQPRVRQHRAVPADHRGRRHHRAAEHRRLARRRHLARRRDRHALNPQASGPDHDRSRRGPGSRGTPSARLAASDGRQIRMHKGLL